ILTERKAFALADKTTFRNILVTMRPKTKKKELCSAYEVSTHLHNKFVGWMETLKNDIEV
ncbi:hypothetical protein M378DRAFT_54975, partial [Amanita muscaria Koide BX008]